MKTIGIIGGIAPASTIEYYRLLVALFRERITDGSYPAIVINSIDMTRMLSLIGAGDSAGTVNYLSAEVQRLARAGAEVAALASNTPHIVFDELQRRSPVPLVSIVEAACDAAAALGLQRLGLFGTRFTMAGRFYPDVFSRRGLSIVMPEEAERELIHGQYMNELVHGVFRAETRDMLLAIADRMQRKEGIGGLILGGTELPLLLSGASARGLPFLDTTRIHVQRLLELAL